LGYLTGELKKGLKKFFGREKPISHGISLVTDEENVVLVLPEALEGLPSTMSRSARIRQLPPHLIDRALPVETGLCIPYTDQEDVDYILSVAAHLV